MEQTIDISGRDFKGLCFTNLVDFDALWGHRRNPIGYGEEIERIEAAKKYTADSVERALETTVDKAMNEFNPKRGR